MDNDLPLSSNGPAYRKTVVREGVPLEYVAEKIGVALEDLHLHLRSELKLPRKSTLQSVDLTPAPLILVDAFHKVVVAYLALHNMLAAANDHSLLARLVAKDDDALRVWMDAVVDGGSVTGLQL
ncbi:MAG: hypothetical protein AB7P21_23005 [Lautropia sp.]